MLQIVIYKKLNFWEEYTPLSLTKKIGFLSNSIVAGTDQTPKMNNMYRLLIVDGTSLFQKNGTQYQLANLGGSRLCKR